MSHAHKLSFCATRCIFWAIYKTYLLSKIKTEILLPHNPHLGPENQQVCASSWIISPHFLTKTVPNNAIDSFPQASQSPTYQQQKINVDLLKG